MAKKQTTKPRNRKAQDATLINIRALKVRVARLERTVIRLGLDLMRLRTKRQ